MSYRASIVGTGSIAHVHAEALRSAGARIVAVVDVDAERLADFAAQWQVPRTFADLDAMLADDAADAPDVVHLCTPPSIHRDQAMACLTTGVHVLCEKPPALSLGELDEIAALESATARFATVFQHRFGGGAGRLREAVRRGDFGRPMTAICNTLWFRPEEYFAVPWRGTWAAEGGGPTMGHGIHQMDLLLSILGPWAEVQALAVRRARPTETEDVSAALVTFADGTVATVVNSLLAPRETSYLRFDFEHATVELEHLYGYDDSCWRITPPDRAWAPTGVVSGHAAQFAAIAEALSAGGAPPVPVAQARDTMELVAAIYASAFNGKPVRRGEIGAGSPHYHSMNGHAAGRRVHVPARSAERPRGLRRRRGRR